MNRTELSAMVRARLNELMPFAASSVAHGENELIYPIGSYVEAMLEDAANDILRVSPFPYVVVSSVSLSVTAKDGGGYVQLPADYLRFANVRHSSWGRDTAELTPEGSPLHRQQSHPPTRAGSGKPVAVATTVAGNRVLMLYPIAAAGTATLGYVKEVAKGWTNTQAFCADVLTAPIAWQCAAKVCSAMGKDGAAKLAAEQARIILAEQ